MIKVINRSPEAWGPLADCTDEQFHQLISQCDARERVKKFVKQKKKMKKFKVRFNQNYTSEQVIVEAESEWQAHEAAAKYFRDNQDKIGFKRPASTRGYDTVSYTKVC